MTRALRSELWKLRTARLPWGLLGINAALTLLHQLLFDSNAGGTGHASIPSLATRAGQSQAITAPAEVLLLATVIGIIIASGEFRHRTATATYLAIPDRAQVLGAKLGAAAAIGLVCGLVGAATATILGLAFVAGSGHALILGAATIFRYAVGGAIGAAVLAAGGVAVGTLIRSQVGAIIAIFIWGFVVEQSVGGVYSVVQRYLPYTAAAGLAGSTLGDAKSPLPFGLALILLTAVVAALAAVAARTTLAADVT
jgi:hypothetical protein